MAESQRWRLLLTGSAAVLLIAAVVALTRGGSPPPAPPLPGTGTVPRSGDPFSYVGGDEARFVERATAGSSQPLFTKSPGGAMATAARVAALRGMIDAATRGTNVDPDTLEGIVFVESAGRQYALAGSDPASAAGLTQILAPTATSLLGMHVDVGQDRRILAALGRANSNPRAAALLRRLVRGDDRFNPQRELAGTVHYLQQAERRFGRPDLAVVSYHMGIGNLGDVLSRYDGGAGVPYAQLYFDTAPDRHASAFSLLSGFGDQSSLYFWRVSGAVAIMHLYRTDRGALARLQTLEDSSDSTAAVLHPPAAGGRFADPGALSAAYAARELIPLPSNLVSLGLAAAAGMGAGARRALGVPAALYRGLRPAALDLLLELAARVRSLAGGSAPLTVVATVSDRRYLSRSGGDPVAATGYQFTLARRYASGAQAVALQAMLDRLQALNLIGWARRGSTIAVTVAGDAGRVIAHGV